MIVTFFSKNRHVIIFLDVSGHFGKLAAFAVSTLLYHPAPPQKTTVATAKFQFTFP